MGWGLQATTLNTGFGLGTRGQIEANKKYNIEKNDDIQK